MVDLLISVNATKNLKECPQFLPKKWHISFQQNEKKMVMLCMQSLEALQTRGRLMDFCSPVRSVLPGHTKASSLQCFPLGEQDYWSKFRYNFIFHVDEMHLKGRGSGWRGEGGQADAMFPAHTDAR